MGTLSYLNSLCAGCFGGYFGNVKQATCFSYWEVLRDWGSTLKKRTNLIKKTRASGTKLMFSHVKTCYCVICFESAVAANSYQSLGYPKLRGKTWREGVSDLRGSGVISNERYWGNVQHHEVKINEQKPHVKGQIAWDGWVECQWLPPSQISEQTGSWSCRCSIFNKALVGG